MRLYAFGVPSLVIRTVSYICNE